MSHFTLFWPNEGASLDATRRERLTASYRRGLGVSLEQREVLFRAESGATTARWWTFEDGWLVVTGSCLDLDAASGAFRERALFDALLSTDSARINRFEGTFAAAAWHTPSRRGVALNDQTSNLNLYYLPAEDGLWVTTAALPVAVAEGCTLDPAGLREYFARGTLLTPRSMFAGMQRLDIGEHLSWGAGALRLGSHWKPWADVGPLRRVESAAEALSDLALDRTRRLADGADRVLADLTGGYDSRLVVSAASAVSRLDAVTVDGLPGHGDVTIAQRVAQAMQWELLHFNPDESWQRPVDAEMRRELTYRVNGELPFADLYPHLQARPLLAQRFGLHLNGGGGELMRSFPWSQEVLAIGRKQKANVENALAYRYFQEGRPPADLFDVDWHPVVVDHFRGRLNTMFDAMPETRNTQQLDAAYLWRMTGFAPYTSAVASWLRSVAPLMCATTVTTAISLPWRLRLSSRLVRSMIERQNPAVAAIETRYGGAAGNFRWSMAHRQLWQLLKMGYHLGMKLDRVRLGGLLSRVLPAPQSDPVAYKPYRTEEFAAFVDPSQMLSAGLYREEGLRRVLESDERWRVRIATVEQLCRELDVRPQAAELVQESSSTSTRTR